eukprot:1952521-Lingulodinium_polyedra.AAC.1
MQCSILQRVLPFLSIMLPSTIVLSTTCSAHHEMRWRAHGARAIAAHSATLMLQIVRLTASSRNVSKILHNGAVKRAFRCCNATKCATHARTTRAP